jgi:cell division protease FtsH
MGNVAAESLELVDSEVRRLVHEAEETARRVLAQNASVLEDLANSLVRAETLSGPSLDVYMEAVTAWPRPLIKDAAGHQPPILMRQDVGDGYADEVGDEAWGEGD